MYHELKEMGLCFLASCHTTQEILTRGFRTERSKAQNGAKGMPGQRSEP